MDRKDFVRTITIGEYVVHIALKLWCQHEDSGEVFGNPWPQIFLQGGDVALLRISASKIVVKNDIAGCFRIYWWEDPQNKSVFITDDVFSFLTEDELDLWPRNEYECRYFVKHGYTSGDSTCYKGIQKIPPFGTLTIDAAGVHMMSEWIEDIAFKERNEAKFRKAVEESMKRMLSPLKNMDNPIVLCFSGGMDSYFLAQMMKRLGINFQGVCFYHKANTPKKDIRLAQRRAAELDLNLTLVDISSMYDDQIEKTIHRLCYFDRHIYRYHFYGLQAVREKWGKDALLVNGQNSDSILSFGPSERKFTSLWKRYLLYGSNRLIKRLFAFIIGRAFHCKLTLPVTPEERARALYDNFKYCLLLDHNDPKDYTEYLDSKIARLRQQFSFPRETEMWLYLKFYTHIQGADSRVVVESAKYHDLHLLMPFVSMSFVESVLYYKDERKELYKPKYVLDF